MTQSNKEMKCTKTSHISKRIIKTKKINYCICSNCNNKVKTYKLETVCCDNPKYTPIFLTKSYFGNK